MKILNFIKNTFQFYLKNTISEQYFIIDVI